VCQLVTDFNREVFWQSTKTPGIPISLPGLAALKVGATGTNANENENLKVAWGLSWKNFQKLIQ